MGYRKCDMKCGWDMICDIESKDVECQDVED